MSGLRVGSPVRTMRAEMLADGRLRIALETDPILAERHFTEALHSICLTLQDAVMALDAQVMSELRARPVDETWMAEAMEVMHGKKGQR